MRNYTKINNQSWNKVAKVHRLHSFDFNLKQFSKGDYNCLHWREHSFLKEINLKGKNVIQLCCNDGREALSLKLMGAQKVVGIDLSLNFIKHAKELSKILDIHVDFKCLDVLKIPKRYWNKFDLVYLSAGTVEWFPDIDIFFEIVSKLLKTNGVLFIHEMHPFLHLVKLKKTIFNKRLEIEKSYFDIKHLHSKKAVTYLPGKYPKLNNQHFFPHIISEMINAIISNGMSIENFNEYPEDITLSYTHIETEKEKVPMSYILTAKKLKG